METGIEPDHARYNTFKPNLGRVHIPPATGKKIKKEWKQKDHGGALGDAGIRIMES